MKKFEYPVVKNIIVDLNSGKLEYGQIYQTIDFDGIELMPSGNRDTRPEIIKKLIKDGKINELGILIPIFLYIDEDDKKLRILEGQNRFRYCEKHTIPVKFIILPEITDKNDAKIGVRVINSSQSQHNIHDIQYRNKGNIHYDKLDIYRKKYGKFIGNNELFFILAGKKAHSMSNREAYKNDNYKIIDNVITAEEIFEEIKEIWLVDNEIGKNRLFQRAMIDLKDNLTKNGEKFDIKILKKAVKKFKKTQYGDVMRNSHSGQPAQKSNLFYIYNDCKN
jgi:hypothetical protein